MYSRSKEIHGLSLRKMKTLPMFRNNDFITIIHYRKNNNNFDNKRLLLLAHLAQPLPSPDLSGNQNIKIKGRISEISAVARVARRPKTWRTTKSTLSSFRALSWSMIDSTNWV